MGLTLLQFFAYACIIGTTQCGDDLLAKNQVPLDVRYATDAVTGFHNIQQYVATLATRPHSQNDGWAVAAWEELQIRVKVLKEVPPDLLKSYNDAIIANSGVVGPARSFVWGKDGNSHIVTTYPLNSRGQ
jgi:hypothetical protein